MKHLSLFLINKVSGWRGRSLWRLCAYFLIGLLAIGCANRMSLDEQRENKINTLSSHAEVNDKQENKINTPISYAEARNALIQVWESKKPVVSTEQIDQLHVSFIGRDEVELQERETYNNEYGIHTNYEKYRFNLAEISEPYVKKPDPFFGDFYGVRVVIARGEIYCRYHNYGNSCVISWDSESDAKDFSKALYALKQYAIKERAKQASEASSFADFLEKARAWRTLRVKPDLPEDVRRYRLLAEDAFQNKEIEKAADYYEQGLEIEPLWPQGQYNAALLYGEIKDYGDAVSHMKRYLELAPDASDAQMARDQLIIWQSKMKQ